MNLVLAITCYAIAMIIANVTVFAFGPAVSPVNAFLLIGLDLVLRDKLHAHLRPWQMMILILSTGVVTYALNPAAGGIAIASSCAFTAAALVDWFVFSRMRGSWLTRSNGSNAAGAFVDSVLFPTIAFNTFMPWIVAFQFAVKVAGAAAWAWMLSRKRGR